MMILLPLSVAAMSGLAQPSSPASSGNVSLSDAQMLPTRWIKQVTHGKKGRILTNIGVWSVDDRWIVYDTRSDPAGEVFDGSNIEMVNVETGAIETLFTAKDGAHCGVATFNPKAWQVVFIAGPEHPSEGWQYGPYHREGLLVESTPGLTKRRELPLDARDIIPPFSAGALRGGSHVHVWDAMGEWVSFTYEDHFLAKYPQAAAENGLNLRNIGVSIPAPSVRVNKGHPRNRDGQYFSVLVSRTTAHPKLGSDQINRAFEEGWIGTNGYYKPDGNHQKRALAFQGQVITLSGKPISEVFIVDLPEDLAVPGDGPLAGTENALPYRPKGVIQRRLTYTESRSFPGLQGPRHWLRSSPDGARIGFLMKDDAGLVQFWTVSPNGGEPIQVTRNLWPIASAFTWSPDGRSVAHVMDHSICITEVSRGVTSRLTRHAGAGEGPRPEACVFSHDGTRIAYVETVEEAGERSNQIFVVSLNGTQQK